ncbi:hypothetical protein CEQ90_17410 [Lewinellaceae bacterium SD302]|nr:hypothetical protein CEQ90_17410 [Lewinellaceae bacterium SD302]
MLPSLLVGQATEDVMTADQIIDNYIEAIGGAKVWKSTKNMKADGKIMMGGMEFNYVVHTSAPNLMRLDADVMGQTLTQSYDGETAWQINPMMGTSAPSKMSEVEAKQVNQSELVPEFIDYAERGFTVELMDEREVEGVATQGIRLTDGKDKDLTYYFDLENFVPIMAETVIKDGDMKGATATMKFSDYQEVDGMMMPFFIENSSPQGSVKLITTKVETNVEIEDGFFAMPEK